MMQVMVNRNGVSLPIPAGNLGLMLMQQLGLEAPAPRVTETGPEVRMMWTTVVVRNPVRVRLPESTVSDGRWLKTTDEAGTPRWFDRNRLNGAWLVDGAWEIKVGKADVVSRKLQHLIMEDAE